MREDEMEALLKIDGAGMHVRKVYAGYEAEVWHPASVVKQADPSIAAVMFTGVSATRQDALAIAWQKYQNFMRTKAGQAMLNSHGQLMFRI